MDAMDEFIDSILYDEPVKVFEDTEEDPEEEEMRQAFTWTT